MDVYHKHEPQRPQQSDLHKSHCFNFQVCKWIGEGVHLGAGDEVYISWGRRLLYRPGVLTRGGQRLLLQLLADYPDEEKLPGIVEGLGGVWNIFVRFFQHYAVRRLPCPRALPLRPACATCFACC